SSEEDQGRLPHQAAARRHDERAGSLRLRAAGLGLNSEQLAMLVQPDRVHRSVYADPAIFELDMERIFGRAWLILGHHRPIAASFGFRPTAASSSLPWPPRARAWRSSSDRRGARSTIWSTALRAASWKSPAESSSTRITATGS